MVRGRDAQEEYLHAWGILDRSPAAARMHKASQSLVAADAVVVGVVRADVLHDADVAVPLASRCMKRERSVQPQFVMCDCRHCCIVDMLYMYRKKTYWQGG